MKPKLLLITIFGLLLSTQLFAKTGKITPYNPEEKVYWDFLKERLFDGENSFVSSFQGDIVIRLDGATEPDSIIVKGLMQELRQIIPNRKVRFSKDFFEVDENGKLVHSINIGFNDKGTINSNIHVQCSKNINGNQIFYDGFKGIYQPEIYQQQINIRLADSISFAVRKRYIEYAIIKSMCTIKGNLKDAKTFIDGAILSDFDYNPINTDFSEVDKFVIQKLYSNDFQKQFKNYMLANGSVKRYLIFAHKDAMKQIGYFVSVFLAMLILLFSYKPIIKRNYRNQYLSYLLPVLLLNNSLLFILFVYRLLATFHLVFYVGSLQLILITNSVAFVLTSVLYLIERFSLNSTLIFSKLVILKVLFTITIIIIPFYILSLFWPRHTELQSVSFWITGITLAVARGIIIYLKHVGELEIREKNIELMALKEVNTRVEIQSLHARINPHFLYNSLNSIAGLAHSDANKTEKMALSLSDMFRYSLNRKDEVLTDINDEVEMVRSYLEIEQIRFGERMSFSIEIDDELKTKKIPKFILQPLVENAIKHGISKIEGKGEISLVINKENQGIEIEVSDNGPDFPEGLVAGYGLQSLYDLLKICYKDAAEVNWQNSPSKMISVRIPLNEKTI